MNSIMHHGVFPAAQGVGNGNARANRKSNEEVDHQIGDGTGCTNSSHTDTAAETPHNDEICRIEQQLQNAGEDNRDCIGNDAAKERPMEHALLILLQVVHSF